LKKHLLLFLFCLPIALSAQITIQGTLYCHSKAVDGISVLAHQQKNVNDLIAFAISNADGSFNISIQTDIDTIGITTRSLNYRDTCIYIANKSQIINLNLQPEQYNLKEVLIKANPINFKKDTIVYNVGAFTKENDRSIGDVINKLPGFEVETNGSINYQGQKIEKYYIEGLDLLEGKYGLANKNLSHKAVRTVEVLENHQSIKMLDTLVFSNKTSINIRLKKDISLAGKARLGIGASPLLWEANLTPMLFTKNQQAIASYQTNNTGDDVSEQLIPHYFSEMKNEQKTEILSVISANNPSIDKNRYLDNNIHLLTYNHIFKLNKDTDIKINSSYVNDYQKQTASIHSTYFVANDTIQVNESSLNKSFTNSLQSDFIYNENSKNKFIKNKLSLSKSWDKNEGIIDNETNQINQYLKTPFSSINNHFKWILPVNKHLMNLKSQISYSETPQNLNLTPSVFNAILDNDSTSNSTVQHALLTNFTSNNSAFITLSKKYWHFDSHIGFEYQKKKLNSFIVVDEAKKEDSYFHNKLEQKYFSPFLSETFRYETTNLNFSFELPLKSVRYDINDELLNKKESLSKLLINPSFYLDYKINGYLSANLSFNYNNRFGDITDIHYSYLLSNYRTLSIKDTPIKESSNYSYSAQLKYINPIQSWFASLLANQTFTTKNILINQTVNDNGSIEMSALLQDNNSKNTNLFFNGSKLLSGIGTTLFLNARYQYAKSTKLSNTT